MSEPVFIVFMVMVVLSGLAFIFPAPFGRLVEWLFNRVWGNRG